MFKQTSQNYNEASNKKRLQNIHNRIQNLDKKAYEKLKFSNFTNKKLFRIQQKLQTCDQAYNKKIQNFQSQIQKFEKIVKDNKKLSQQKSKNEIQTINSIHQILQFKSLEDIRPLNFHKEIKTKQKINTKIQQFTQQLELVTNQLSNQEQQRNQVYSLLVSNIGESIQEIQLRIKEQRENRTKINQNIKKMILQLQQQYQEDLNSQYIQRTKNEQEFTKLLQQTCKKLQNQLLRQQQ